MNDVLHLAHREPSTGRALRSDAHLFDRDSGTLGRTGEALAERLAATAVERDKRGGSPIEERNAVRASGLLTLAVPRRFGGQGTDWPTIYRITRRLAEADSSLAHLFAFHHLQVASVLLWGNEEQHERFLVPTVSQRWFWGNAANGLDKRAALTRRTGGFVLAGTKSFCSGALDSDALLVTVPHPTGEGRVALVVPTLRDGITLREDWDAIGQRQTDSGTVDFASVHVDANEILAPGPTASPRATLRALFSQQVLVEIYLGNAQGALAAAWRYVNDEARPAPAANVERAVDDPYVQAHFGDYRLALRGATSLANEAHGLLQQAWDRGDALTAVERGRVAIAVAEARLASARAALDITASVFEVMGARSTASRHGFDRFWRNVRTHTLHDSLDYKLRDLGRWVLRAQVPTPSLYS